MTAIEQLVKDAVNGDQHAQEELLLLVEPIISRNSVMYGKTDEDLRQQIILRILVELKNWRGVQKNEG